MFKSEGMKSIHFTTVQFTFFALYLFSATISHIDDTDETFGYWEPLHYLLQGHGMQTWEYSLKYAIRTYSFIAPIWIIGMVLKCLGLNKLLVFVSIKAILGLFSAYSQTLFLQATSRIFNGNYIKYALFFACSSGIFFSSTSYLPSAICSSLVLLSFTSFIHNNYIYSIAYGCFAVIWSGWPFVAVIFLPIGISMILRRFQSKGLVSVVKLLFGGIIMLISITIPSLLIDIYFYKQRTFPPLNILLYNALGGRGDELYGVEPASYYVKNLVLNLSPMVVVLATFLPVIRMLKYALVVKIQPGVTDSKEEKRKKTDNDIQSSMLTGLDHDMFVISVSVYLWLGLLFSRPHKEERFLYPVLPLLASMGAYTLHILGDITDIIINTYIMQCQNKNNILSKQGHKIINTTTTTTSTAKTKITNKNEINERNAGNDDVNDIDNNNNIRTKSSFRRVFSIFEMIILSTTMCWGISRVSACRRNYSGYINLWKLTSEIISQDIDNITIKAATTSINDNDNDNDSNNSNNTSSLLRLCMGGDWYTFPSHFFLPNHARLAFVNDTFHGQLPQLFKEGKDNQNGKESVFIGTYTNPNQPFNDENKEENSRYISIFDCDYVVSLIHIHNTHLHKEIFSDENKSQRPFHNVILDPSKFEIIGKMPVINAAESLSLSRAFWIPFTANKNVFSSYTLFRKIK